jgi:hypothetical protein
VEIFASEKHSSLSSQRMIYAAKKVLTVSLLMKVGRKIVFAIECNVFNRHLLWGHH